MRVSELLDPRSNSLNAIRLVLASLVIVSHSWPLGGYGEGPVLGGASLGTWAVYGFFGISGYLITKSRLSRRSAADYYRARAARIMPAFIACLVVTAFLLAPLSLVLGADAYSLPDAVSYVIRNIPLYPPVVWQHSIGETLALVPYPDFWNGSLWTLFYEACCYVLIGVAVSLVPEHRVRWVVLLTFVLATAVSLLGDLGAFSMHDRIESALRLLVAFLAGGVLWLYGHRLPVNKWTTSIAIVWGALSIGILSSPILGVFVYVYLMISLGALLPLRSVGAKHDISYGIYIYGWPIQQLVALAITPAATMPVFTYALIALGLTLPLAWLSFVLVERPAMDWAQRASRRQTARLT